MISLHGRGGIKDTLASDQAFFEHCTNSPRLALADRIGFAGSIGDAGGYAVSESPA